ncbi:MAG: tetratricopeptide repeat protein [Thermoplasmata archaeon]
MPLLGRRAPSSSFIQMLRDLLEEGKFEATTNQDKAKITLRKIHRMISDADPSEEQAIEQNKNEVTNILLEAGSLLFELSDKDKSIDYFEKVKEMDPNNARAWFEIGRILVSQNIQIPYAMVNLKKALDIDKTNHRAMVLLGDLYRIQRDNNNAMKWYMEALKLSPDKMEILDRILNIDPSNKDALRQKLEYYLEKGDRENAAQIYLQLGIIEDNIDILDEGLKISPDNLSLLKEKARLLINHGKKSEATQFIERVKKLSSGDPEIAILESMITEPRATVQEDIFGDIGIPSEMETREKAPENIEKENIKNENIEVLKEPEMDEIEHAILSGRLNDLISKYYVSESFIDKINKILMKHIENYEIFVPALEMLIGSGLGKEALKQVYEKLGTVFDAISLFLQNRIDDAEKILNGVVVKDQKNALAWFYKARIAGLKNNAIGSKNFLMMARKFGNFDKLVYPELKIASQ